jgi:hypothetical protein
MEEEKPRKFDLPLWLGLALIVLGIAGGVWFFYNQVSDYVAGTPRSFVIKGVNAADHVAPPTSRAPRIGPGGRAPGGGGNLGGARRPPTNMGDEIRSIGSDTIRIRAGALLVNARFSTDKMTLTGSLLNAATLHPDFTITQLLKSRMRAALARELGLTDEQVGLLQKVRGSPMTYPVPFSAEEISSVKSLLDAWRSAPEANNTSQTAAVLEAVRRMAPAKTEAAKAGAAAEVGAFRQSVSDEGWQKIRQAVTSSQ